jgi:4-oxalocrotonate tautomerase
MTDYLNMHLAMQHPLPDALPLSESFSMPLLQLNLTNTAIDDQQRARVHTGLAERMASILGKRADLTVVSIAQSNAGAWSLGGQTLTSQGWCASLLVHITAGTNTAEELSRFIASAYALLQEVLAASASAPVYIIVHEIAAHSWGYDGRTQLSRRTATPALPI